MRHNVVQARPTEASDAVDRHLYWVWHNIGETRAEGELIESAMQEDAARRNVMVQDSSSTSSSLIEWLVHPDHP